MKRLLCLATAPLLLGACQTGAPTSPVLEAAPAEPQTPTADKPQPVAAGDQLEIVVHAAPELSRTVMITPAGMIRLPYVDPILVAGLSLKDVEYSVRDALASELRNPSVSVFRVGGQPLAGTPCGLE